MKPPAAQLRELITIAAIREELRREAFRLIEEIERRHENDLTKREDEYRREYERRLRK